ncbi:hypothetical protein BDF21DRAFT_416972 [Thamnidium elegans]|nr:hypothetical protein BDF21DRAFT_416972 [Thamnidium elegans]
MEYQFGSLAPVQQQASCSSSKRRMDDGDDEPIVTKRYFDLHTQFSPNQPMPEKDLPAITYASPDYRPPPPTDTPLWLQPMNATSPMTEDDSEDESVITPSYQQKQQVFGKPAVEYWGDMMVDQWQ